MADDVQKVEFKPIATLRDLYEIARYLPKHLRLTNIEELESVALKKPVTVILDLTDSADPKIEFSWESQDYF